MKREIVSNPSPYFKKADIVPRIFTELSSEISKKNGEIYIVGGWVRDALLGVFSTDFDFEVYGLSINELKEVLNAYGKVDLIGKFFGVLHLNLHGYSCDFAVPRKESSVGLGHKDFYVSHEPDITFENAAIRRDFTINSMALKLSDKSFIDPFKGFKDLKKGILRHVSQSFPEDPLRVLRAVRFASMLNFKICYETVELCRKISLKNLSKERIFEELKKILLDSPMPSTGMEWLRRVGGLEIFPELHSLIGLEQNPEWHPEGDVWTHTGNVLDNAARLNYADQNEKLIIMLAALCHDMGKAVTTQKINEKIVSPKHEPESARIAEVFLKKITNDKELIKEVVILVREHSMPWQLYHAQENVTGSAIRRLSLKVNIKKLLKLVEADWRGTGPKKESDPFLMGAWLAEEARKLEVLENRPKRILTGKILLKLGMSEGPQLGQIIKEAYDLQLEGKISNEKEALDFARLKLGLA